MKEEENAFDTLQFSETDISCSHIHTQLSISEVLYCWYLDCVHTQISYSIRYAYRGQGDPPI